MYIVEIETEMEEIEELRVTIVVSSNNGLGFLEVEKIDTKQRDIKEEGERDFWESREIERDTLTGR